MLTIILAAAVLGAEPAAPTAEQTALLKKFHAEFVLLTPGQGDFPASYERGRAEGSDAEKPVQEVTIRAPFHMAKYEVTQELWQGVTGENPSKWKGPRNSVEMLTFQEAVDFCSQATKLMRAAKLIADDEAVQLPSEAQWEYAARAGTKTIYSFGDDAKELGDYGWFTGNAAGNDPPVGAKKPNAWKLYDMHGYLWEWCLDDWQGSYDNAPVDGSARQVKRESPRGVVRSGSWKDKADRLTSSFRMELPRETRDDAVGLRCVLVKTPKN